MKEREWIGGCLCGYIRYRIQATAKDETHCHCTLCRRATGAPFVSWATFPKDKVQFNRTPKTYRSSPIATRGFCPNCGTQLTFQNDDYPEELDMTIASFDHPDDLSPKDHLWTENKINWIHLDDGLPNYATRRQQGASNP